MGRHVYFVLVAGIIVAAYTYMGDMGRDLMNVKFDFKMAKSNDQRLDDVKGMDEIKDEITNVIRIIKNPSIRDDQRNVGGIRGNKPTSPPRTMQRAVVKNTGWYRNGSDKPRYQEHTYCRVASCVRSRNLV